MTKDYTQHVMKQHAVDAGLNGGRFYHATIRDRHGRAATCRANGKCKTWKTRPDEFRLPVKHGWKDCFYITENNCQDWLLYDPTSPAVLLVPFRTTDVVELAARVWWDQTFAPLLADALQEAGYGDEKVLANMRSGKLLTLSTRHSVLSYLLPEDFDHSGPPCPKCGKAMSETMNNNMVRDGGYDCFRLPCNNQDTPPDTVFIDSDTDPRCSHPDSGVAGIYNCDLMDCPRHGERNRTLYTQTPAEVA